MLGSKMETKHLWESLRGILENAIYGGKIDVDNDFVKLKTYLEFFFNDGNLSFMLEITE